MKKRIIITYIRVLAQNLVQYHLTQSAAPMTSTRPSGPLKKPRGVGQKKATNTKNKSKETEKKGKKGNAEPVQNTSQPEDIPYELRQLLAM